MGGKMQGIMSIDGRLLAAEGSHRRGYWESTNHHCELCKLACLNCSG